MTETKYICSGCGSEIQTTDNKKPGFVPERIMNQIIEGKTAICQRCFRIQHYADIASNDLPGEDYIKVLSQINAKDSLVVLIVDIFDFSGSFLPNIKRITGQNDVVLAANKVDLLPSSVNKEKVLEWVMGMTKEEGLNVLDSILISSKKNIYIDELISLIARYRKGRDVYIVGSSNVGKSKLINAMIKRLNGTNDHALTVSYAPNTTLNFVGFPMDGWTLYDTPGVLNRHQYLRYLTKKSLKLCVPQKEIKPQVYQLDIDQTLFVGGLARFDFISGSKADKTNVVLYFSNSLFIHRTKLEAANQLYEEKLYTLLTPPFSTEEALPKFTQTDFHVRGEEGKYDIVISGLGFISLKAPFHVIVHAPVMVGVYLRKAII